MIKLTALEHNIIFYAFRYALGRQTYAPSEVVGYLETYWLDIPTMTRHKIQSEIREAIGRGEAGSSIDIKTWKKVLDLEV